MQKLFTITGNLLAETTAEFPPTKDGETVRCVNKCSFQVGGKGVNVAKAFHKLSKEKPHAIIFPAGFNGKRCVAELNACNFCNVQAFEIDGETRTGLVCINSNTKIQTTFLGEDIKIPETAFNKALKKIEKLSNEGDFVAICGSFIGWKSNYAKQISNLCKRKKLRLCIDTYGKPLKDFAKQQTFLLKINKKEFLETFNQQTLSLSTFKNCVLKIPAKNFIVSNSKGPTFANFQGEFIKINPPKIKKEVSATGCGDTMFASLIFEMSKNTSNKNALKNSIARASASAEILATSDWNENRAKQLSKEIS